jgi:hypothetical protein
MATDNFLNGDLFIKAFERVFALEFLQLCRGILVKELVDGKITTTYSDIDLVFVNPNVDFLGSELVDTVAFTHEHDFKLLTVWEVVNILS